MPAHLKGEPHLILQYGLNLPIPIPDLEVTDEGVTATLSFAQTPSPTVVPWSAVYVVTTDDGRGVLYHEDIPGDVSVIAGGGEKATADLDAAEPVVAHAGEPPETAERAAAEDRGAARIPTPSRALRAVPLTGPIDGDQVMDLNVGGPAPAEALAPTRRRKRPQLRLVK